MVSTSLIFQYQKGAIKTRSSRTSQSVTQAFQYQKGAIKTDNYYREGELHARDFNTKKVRLKPLEAIALAKHPNNFNTKKVRLKRKTTLTLSRRYRPFQYQKGAIKTGPYVWPLGRRQPISIPKRCD